MDDNTKRAVVARGFSDAGTGESFTAGQNVELNPGRFANFEAAGLVTDAPDGAELLLTGLAE